MEQSGLGVHCGRWPHPAANLRQLMAVSLYDQFQFHYTFKSLSNKNNFIRISVLIDK